MSRTTTRTALIALALATASPPCASLAATAPSVTGEHARLEVAPLRALAGDSISVTVRGLPPGALATVHAQSIALDDSAHSELYHAEATFMADADGTIDLASAAPVTGDYSGADVRGLFWSQRILARGGAGRDSVAEPGLAARNSIAPGQTVLTLELAGAVVDRRVLTFLRRRPETVREEVRATGIVGVLYYEKTARKRPVIVVLGGSEGGLDLADWIGPKLAARGFVVFGLAYFSPPQSAMDGVPTALTRIPIESLATARAWLSSHAEADTTHVGLFGYSKGAEFALVLASTYDWIQTVVAYAPSDCVWQGIRYGGGASAQSSWSRGGHDLPFLPTTGTREAIAMGRESGEQVRLAPIAKANRAAATPEALAAAAIPLERSHAALMLIGGGDDQEWDSGASVERLAARLKRAAYSHPYEVLMYPAAGHTLIGTGWQPTTTDNDDLFLAGGTPEADAHAQADSWPRMLAFLNRELRP